MFTTIKAYTAATAEVGAPAANYANFSTVVGLARNRNLSRLVEIRVDAPVLGGTVAATSALLDIYRFNSATASVDYIATAVILAADITSGRVPPVIVETWGNELTTRLRFADGTAPTLTGTVQGRALE